MESEKNTGLEETKQVNSENMETEIGKTGSETIAPTDTEITKGTTNNVDREEPTTTKATTDTKGKTEHGDKEGLASTLAKETIKAFDTKQLRKPKLGAWKKLMEKVAMPKDGETNITMEDETAEHSEEELIAHITEVVLNSIAIHDQPKTNGIFYAMVRRGQIRIVRGMLKRLKDRGLHDEIKKIVTRPEPQTSSTVSRANWVVFILLHFFFILSTPVFYLCHKMFEMYFSSKKIDLVKNINLPIVMALVSTNKEMFDLFINHGASIHQTDRKGNNMFHYLAEISLTEPDLAIHCFDFMNGYVSSRHVMKKLLNHRNIYSYTGLEATARFGSLDYLVHILEANQGANNSLQISDDKMLVTLEGRNFEIPIPKELNPPTREESNGNTAAHVDLDTGDYGSYGILGKYSDILLLIASRPVSDLPARDAQVIPGSHIMQKLSSFKRKKTRLYMVMTYSLSIIITMLFITELGLNKGDMNKYPLIDNYLGYFMQPDVMNGTKMILEDSGYSINGSVLYNIHLDLPLAETKKDCAGLIEEGDVVRNIFVQAHDVLLSWIAKYILHNITLCMVCIHGLFDIISRLEHLHTNYDFCASGIFEACAPVLGRLMAGSYAEKQMTILMYSLFLTTTSTLTEYDLVMQQLNDDVKTYYNFDNLTAVVKDEAGIAYTKNLLDQAMMYREYNSIIFIFCLLLRIITLIHAMRLLPRIGFFILTTKRLVNIMWQFTLVFVMVLVPFGGMMHLVLRDPQCPAGKVQGFDTLKNSVLTAYHLSLGYGSPDYTNRTTNSTVTFIIGTVVMMILMLNLIIAIMTTTATDMNLHPWKEALMCVEEWREILEAEGDVIIFQRPVKLVRKLYRNCTKKFK